MEEQEVFEAITEIKLSRIREKRIYIYRETGILMFSTFC